MDTTSCSSIIPILGEEHWLSRGRSRHEAAILVEFQENLIRDIYALTLGARSSLDIGVWEEDAFIRADDAVQCPTWQILCAMLRDADVEGHVGALSFLNFDVTVDILEGLGPALVEVKALGFEDSRLGKRTLSTLAAYLESNTSLTDFRLMTMSDGEEFEDLIEVRRFYNVLGKHPNLCDFCMSRKLRDHPGVLPIIMDGVKDIQKVSFCWMLCPSQGHHIASVIAQNGAMKELMIGCETCNGKDAVDVACALAKNTNLRSLQMSVQDQMFDPDRSVRFSSQDEVYNEEMGRDALRNACFDLSSGLNNILDLNHTCALDAFEGVGDSRFQKDLSLKKECRDLMAAGAPRETVIRRKLLHALGAYSVKGVDVGKLEDIPSELLPRAFHLFQAADDARISMANTLILLRDCVVQKIGLSKPQASHRKRKTLCSDSAVGCE